jgi:uncharacterized protein YqhQ
MGRAEGLCLFPYLEQETAMKETGVREETMKNSCIGGQADKYKIASLPILRGMVTLVESLSNGMSTLNYSASFYEEEEEKQERTEEQKKQDEKKENIVMGLLMVVAVIAAVGIFVAVPFLASESLKKVVRSAQLRGLVEGIIRVILFVAYIKLISRMEDIKRVFMYHGAEHKSINCIENGLKLTVENVKKQNMVHKRCGTSFMLVVMIISILFFMFIVVENIWLRMLFRILLIPVIAGVAYEFICFAGSHDGVIINVLSKPGLWLQSLTTREPDEDMIEVAIASVEAVFDWETFVSAEEPGETDEQEEVEIMSIDSEEDDEILKALDRYFEAPDEVPDKTADEVSDKKEIS